MSATRMPDFIIAGAAKSATTWLQQSLQESDRIYMPDHEPHFFSRDYDAGMDSYRALFGAARPGMLIGEKSNSYLTTPGADQRIHRHLPDVRLIFQLRDPVARAYSDYCMLFRRGTVDGDIARHLDPERAAHERFLSDGCYADHLQRFLDLFGRQAILVLLYEDVRSDPQGNLDRLARHIGLDDQVAAPVQGKVKDASAAAVPRGLRRMLAPLRPILDPIRHTAPVRMMRQAVARPYRYPALEPGLRSQLQDFYRPQIVRLQNMTNCNLGVWNA